MADKKISQLTSATTPLAGTEVLPIVQSGSTVKVSSDDLTVKNVRSNATTGILQIAGPGAGTTRVMTTPNANFTAARTDAAQTFTGDQTFSTVLGTTFDTNVVAAGVTLSGTTLSADGTDSNIDITVTPKGTGKVSTKAIWTNSPDGTKQLTFTPGNTLHQILGDYSSGANVPIQIGIYGFPNMLTFNTDGTLSAKNNLKFTDAGDGIDFSANTHAAGMTSELLDWYETGTFTPVLSCATPGTLAVTYSVQKGYYTRVGRVVHIWGNIQTSAVTVGTATGAVRLTGLPFTSAASSTAVETYMGSMGYQGITKAGYTDFNPQLQENTTYVLILASKSDGGAAANVQIGDLSTGTNLLYWQVTYVAA